MEDGAVWQLLMLVAGFYLLVRGADCTVEGASALALRFGLSSLVVGLTIVAFGTSAPELATSLAAAVQAAHGNVQAADVAMGNVVGSNICNLGLILGITAAAAPLTVSSSLVRREIPFLIMISVLLVVLSWRGGLDAAAGVVLLVAFATFLIVVFFVSLRGRKAVLAAGVDDAEARALRALAWWKAASLVLLGLVLLTVGADLLVESAVALAASLGVSSALVSLTVVAIGTSLPELATTLLAARRGRADLALGNIVGSNIFNVGLVLGLPAALVGVPVNPDMVEFDMSIMLAFTVALLPLCLTRGQISRREGAVLLTGYVLYLGLRVGDALWL